MLTSVCPCKQDVVSIPRPHIGIDPSVRQLEEVWRFEGWQCSKSAVSIACFLSEYARTHAQAHTLTATCYMHADPS